MTASLHKLSAGDGYTYLTRQVAASDSTELGRQALSDYYSAKGESPGVWRGRGMAALGSVAAGDQVTEAHMRALFGEGRHPDADRIEQAVATQAINAGATAKQAQEAALEASALGARYGQYDDSPSEFIVQVTRAYRDFNKAHGLPRDAPVPADERAAIRTRIGTQTFTEQFGRAPLDARELQAHIARESRPPRQAVAGYDVTFSPVKSVSTLWAIAPREVSEQVEAAHAAAVRDAMEWVENTVTYTRRGRGGVRQVDVHGLLMAAFTHRDSRAGDPDLHTHVAISNKVQAVEDGAWLALDGQPVHKALVAASERYNTRLEAEMRDRLGVEFAPRADAAGPDSGKREVREIVGVDPQLMGAWSSRRAAIETRKAALTTQFMAAHGRPPTPKEAIALAQQATLDTREDKHEPRSLAEQRAAWHEQAITVLGGQEALDRMVDSALAPSPTDPVRLTRERRQTIAAQVLDRVESSRATWQMPHVRAEAERAARTHNVPLAEVDQFVDDIVATALGKGHSTSLAPRPKVTEPAELRRADGVSQYERAHTALFTSQRVLDSEDLLLTAAKRTDGRRLDHTQVSIALLESAANGVTLNPAQAQMVAEMATSGARLQLALAPAGSGKTTAMRALTRAWESSGGTVIGLAPSAVAAAELGSSIDTRADTMAKLLHHVRHGGLHPWMRDIGKDTLVIVDEAGMASTPDLAAAVEYVTSRGGSVRLVGDDRQLAAIGAGGVLRDIATGAGAITLSELHRFRDVAEGEATLALRDGHAHALGFYLDHGRIKVSADTDTVVDQVLAAWQDDVDAGRPSLMLAHTNTTVDALNERARAHRLATLTDGDGPGSDPPSPEVTLRSGLHASAGDQIVTRHNDRSLRVTSTHWVRNGDRWHVGQVLADGGILAHHDDTGRTVTLPAAYVAEHVDLGYATTYHGAQGSTVETTHCVLTGSESRQLMYVGLSRGRARNTAYVLVSGDGDPHNAIRPEVISPASGVDILEQILARDDSPRSAHTERDLAAAPATTLADMATRYADAVDHASTLHLGPDRIAQIASAAEDLHPGLTAAPAWETLLGHLARLEADGTPALPALAAAIAERDLSTALDPAAVLDWRLAPDPGAGAPEDETSAVGPLPWLPVTPSELDTPWGVYLAQVAEHVVDSATEVHRNAVAADPEDLPTWAHPIADDRDLVGDIACWRAATGVPDDHPDPVGPPHPSLAYRRAQNDLAARVREHTGRPTAPGHRWREAIAAHEPRVLDDPYWPVLARRLDLAASGGIDAQTLLTDALTTGPLPDDHPAAALFSRLTPHLSPAAAATAIAGSGADRLRPPWWPALAEHLGPDHAATVMADPYWPGLVAAVHEAAAAGVDPEAAVSYAASRIDTDAIGTSEGVAVEGLAMVLAWRVHEAATHPADHDNEPPPPAEDIDALPPRDVEAILTEWAAAHDRPLRTHTTPDGAADDQSWTDTAGEELPEAPSPDWDPDWTPLDDWAPPPEDDHNPPPPEADAAHAEPATPENTSSLERLFDLTGAAADYYTGQLGQHPHVAAYLAQRTGGADLTPYVTGYAPDEWDALVQHLRAEQDATDTELVDAGLAKYSRRGTLIDVFRNRLTFGLHDTDGRLVGFTGRAAPGTDDPRAPKYLNTPATPIFTKGALLFGLHEHQDAIRDGAMPARVEGVLDAIAITAASDNNVIGLAPLGTALTDAQARLLVDAAGHDRQVLLAPDNDPAGLKAAEADYWKLTNAGIDPRVLPLPPGTDPAQAWADDPDTLRSLLTAARLAPTLAETVTDRRLALHAEHLAHGWIEARVNAARAIAPVIAAAPLQHWEDLVNHAAGRIGPHAEDLVWNETIQAALDWHPHDNPTTTGVPAEPDRAAADDLDARLAAIQASLGDNRASQIRDRIAQARQQAGLPAHRPDDRGHHAPDRGGPSI